MSKWVEVGTKDQFEPGSRQCVQANGQELVVFNLDEQFYAIENVCPHAGMPLDQGSLDGRVLTCPFHGYAFDVADGRNVDDERETPVETFPVKVEDEKVLVEVG